VQGPIGNNFAGPHSVVCTEIFEEHQIILIEIGDVKEEIRKERPTASLVGSALALKLISCASSLPFLGKISVVITGDPPCPK